MAFWKFWRAVNNFESTSPEAAEGGGRRPLLTSLGLAIIDEIQFGSGEIVKNMLGGSATYCTLGARLFAAGVNAKSISWLIRAGDDFPSTVEAQIGTWDVNLRLQKSPDQKSTRGLLIYKDTTFGPKTFKYTTPVNEVLPRDLAENNMLLSQYFHTLCPPDQIKPQVDDLLRLVYSRGLNRPFIIWEPSPPWCKPESLQVCLESVESVDVFSPNHLELLSLFGCSEEAFNKDTIHELASRILQAGVGPEKQGVVVIRAGEHGCLVMPVSSPPVWLPPFYESSEAAKPRNSKIVDTTGAGNAFLGGFILGHSETVDFVKAAHYGSVAASFVLEQVGIPKLDKADPLGTGERWNGDDPRERLHATQESAFTRIKSGWGHGSVKRNFYINEQTEVG